MTYKLAIENQQSEPQVSPSKSPISPKGPFEAFLVQNDSQKLKKSVSLSDIDGDREDIEPAGRRFSLCDLDDIGNQSSPREERKKEFFNFHQGNEGNHHRRNSVAIKFQAPKTIE